jgi:hypothetical protein
MSQQKNEILFGGAARTLKFDIAAMIALESATGGTSTGQIVASLANWNFTNLVLALWAGLRHEDEKRQVSTVQRWLEKYVTLPGSNLRQLRDAVRAAIEASTWYRQAISADDDEPVAGEEEDKGEA